MDGLLHFCPIFPFLFCYLKWLNRSKNWVIISSSQIRWVTITLYMINWFILAFAWRFEIIGNSTVFSAFCSGLHLRKHQHTTGLFVKGIDRLIAFTKDPVMQNYPHVVTSSCCKNLDAVPYETCNMLTWGHRGNSPVIWHGPHLWLNRIPSRHGGPPSWPHYGNMH